MSRPTPTWSEVAWLGATVLLSSGACFAVIFGAAYLLAPVVVDNPTNGPPTVIQGRPTPSSR